jgi:hypothetical protein
LQNKNTILNKGKENKRLKQQKVENLLQLELQKYKTTGYTFDSNHIIDIIYTYYYLKKKNTKKIQVSYLTELQIAKNYMS